MVLLKHLQIFFQTRSLRLVVILGVIGCIDVAYEWFEIHYSFLAMKSTNVHVIDGDTIILNNIKVRLKGIDAPELKQTCQKANKHYLDCGIYAKIKLLSLVKGNKVFCSKSGVDKYKRQLSFCYSGGKNLNLELIKDGYAYSYRHQNLVLNFYELLARQDNKGLWSLAFQKPWEWRREHLK